MAFSKIKADTSFDAHLKKSCQVSLSILQNRINEQLSCFMSELLYLSIS